jgi:hypothetical protein
VYDGVAVDLAGGGLEDFYLQAFGKPQHVDAAVDGRLGRLHRVELIVNGRGGAGQIINLVHLDKQRECDVVTQKLEVRIAQKMGDVFLASGIEIIQTDDLAALV